MLFRSDLSFATQSEYFENILVELKNYRVTHPEIAEDAPIFDYLNNKVPGEEVIVRRMIWEIVHKAKYHEYISDDHILLFESHDEATYGNKFKTHLRADKEILENPNSYFDQVIELDLSKLEPHINGPFSPDKSRSISQMKDTLNSEDWPTEIEVGLIGSCTNSSYEDISRAASIARQARKLGLKTNSKLTITPGSEQVRYTIERDGFIEDFKSIDVDFII